VDHRIRIEKHHVPTPRQTDGLIVGRGKPPILSVGYERNIGETVLYHPHRSIPRGVVHNEDLVRYPPGVLEDGLETRLQLGLGIPVHDANGEINHV